MPRSLRFTDPPSTPEQLAAAPPDREAEPTDGLVFETTVDVPADGAEIEQSSVVVRGFDAGAGTEQPATEIRISYRPSRIGARAIPPSVPAERVDPPDAEIVAREERRLERELDGKVASPEQLADLESAIARAAAELPRISTDAGVPKHLAVRSVPEPMPEEVRATRFPTAPANPSLDAPRPTTVFLPENRQVLWDTAYPWGCNGRVTTGNGAGSGVMVGPRHLLTVSHVMVWNNDGSVGWLEFVPAFFDREPGPFGKAHAIRTYYHRKVTGGLDEDERRHDYVVVVLNWRIGDRTGWLGSKSYTDAWDGQTWWSHVGYPADFGGLRPTWQSSISLDGHNAHADSNQEMHHWGDVAVGQSGGPFFAWWDGVPHAVAVQSSHDSGRNYASGGSYIPNLINRARSEFP